MRKGLESYSAECTQGPGAGGAAAWAGATRCDACAWGRKGAGLLRGLCPSLQRRPLPEALGGSPAGSRHPRGRSLLLCWARKGLGWSAPWQGRSTGAGPLGPTPQRISGQSNAHPTRCAAAVSPWQPKHGGRSSLGRTPLCGSLRGTSTRGSAGPTWRLARPAAPGCQRGAHLLAGEDGATRARECWPRASPAPGLGLRLHLLQLRCSCCGRGAGAVSHSLTRHGKC